MSSGVKIRTILSGNKMTTPITQQTYCINRLNIGSVEMRIGDAAPDKTLKIIALHGWLDNAYSFKPLFDLWQKKDLPSFAPFEAIHCIAFDLVGHGLSKHRPYGTHYHLVDYLRDVVHLADTLNWASFTLLGHSLGGGLCLLLAGLFPDRVQSVISIEGAGPHIQPDFKDWLTQTRFFFSQDKKGADKKLPCYPTQEEGILARQKGNVTGAICEQAVRILCERGLVQTEKGWMWRTDPRLLLPSVLRFQEVQVIELFTEICCPVLLILAKEGSLKKASYLSARSQAIKKLTTIELSGDHHLHMEAALPAILQAMSDFLMDAPRVF